jgi:uncharacterized membrane protein YagU involved in acid resistance
MTDIWAGLLAGFGATIVLSAMMLAKQGMGLMPQFEMIGMMAGMMGGSRTVAWLVHFMVGTVVYGGAFVLLIALFGSEAYIWMGILLGAIGWLIASLMMMPMAGNRVFGVNLGTMVPVMSLVMHLIFGAILGWIYGAMIAA